jgi:acyl-CoA reductase-like NAD-dependent aldehyde dehydrogenase
MLIVQQRPAGPDELKISVSELRSQFAELALLDAQAAGLLPPRFVRAHANQLADAVEQTRDDLARLHTRSDLAGVRAEANRHAKTLADAVRRLEQAGRPLPAASASGLLSARLELNAIEEALRR